MHYLCMMMRSQPDQPEWTQISAREPSAAAALDLWIMRDLRRCYDATLAEPLPAELLNLVAALSGPSDQAR
jgi:hypothetical protein